jgi:hypothetical protein
MYYTLTPWESITIQIYGWKVKLSTSVKCYTFGLTFDWVRICTEFQVVIIGMFLTYFNHFLQSIYRWTKERAIVSIEEGSKPETFDSATNTTMTQ